MVTIGMVILFVVICAATVGVFYGLLTREWPW